MNGIWFSIGFALFAWFVLMVVWYIRETRGPHAQTPIDKKHSRN